MKILIILLVGFVVPVGLFGQITYVTNTNDSGIGSLRAAVDGAVAGQTILFDASIAGQTIVLVTELTPSVDMTIDGQGNDISVSGNNSVRIFNIDGGGSPLNVTLNNLTLTQGRSGNGGAVYALNGGQLTADHIIFISNTAIGDGGAVRCFGNNHFFTNCEFIGNDASSLGGGFYQLFGSVYFENCLFSGNKGAGAGALYLRGSSSIINTTVTGNFCTNEGGAMFIYVNASVDIKNSIFWNNQKTGQSTADLASFYEIHNGSTINMYIQNSCIEGSGGSGSWDAMYGANMGSNIDADPLFANQLAASAAPTTGGNYRPQSPSPVFDTGDNVPSTQSLDLDDHGRIMYGIIDMGCYEFCSTYSNLSPVVCSSYFSPAGNIYTVTGSYSDTLTNYLGCDSVITIDLTVNNSFDTISPVVCDSYVMPGGAVVTTSGTYNDTIPNYLSCDSVITVYLTVNNQSTGTISPAACYSYTSPSGLYTWNTTGTYNDTIPNYLGCDSVITVNLSINTSYNSIAETHCDSLVSPSGLYTWTTTGTYNDTIPNYLGCDSVITVNLTIINSTSSVLTEIHCDSLVSPSSLYTWTTTGTYQDTIPNSAGCDSIITVNLTINSSTNSTINETVCNSYTSPSGLYTWTTSGMYTDTVLNTVGCDSVITVNLTVNYESTSTINETACDSYTSPGGLYTWTTSGTYMDTIPNTAGCDSIITVNLTVSYSTAGTISPLSCDPYTSPSGLYTWTASGTYMDTIVNTVGCDSVITVNLTIPAPVGFVDTTVCDEYISPSGLYTWTNTGIYTDTLTGFQGCDSVISVNLIVFSANNSLTLDGKVFTAAAADDYIWISCESNDTLLIGEQEYEATQTGEYAVIVELNGCVDTSDCMLLDFPFIENSAFSPNGDGVNDVLALHIDNLDNQVTVFNRWGDEIVTFIAYDDVNVYWDGTNKKGQLVDSGTYFYVVEVNGIQQSGWIQVFR